MRGGGGRDQAMAPPAPGGQVPGSPRQAASSPCVRHRTRRCRALQVGEMWPHARPGPLSCSTLTAAGPPGRGRAPLPTHTTGGRCADERASRPDATTGKAVVVSDEIVEPTDPNFALMVDLGADVSVTLPDAGLPPSFAGPLVPAPGGVRVTRLTFPAGYDTDRIVRHVRSRPRRGDSASRWPPGRHGPRPEPTEHVRRAAGVHRDARDGLGRL